MKQIAIWRQRTGGFIYTPELVPLEPTQYALCDDTDYPWLSQWLYVSPDECRIETMHRMVMEAERTAGSLGKSMATTSTISAAICTGRSAGGDRRGTYLAGWAYLHLAPAPTDIANYSQRRRPQRVTSRDYRKKEQDKVRLLLLRLPRILQIITGYSLLRSRYRRMLPVTAVYPVVKQ